MTVLIATGGFWLSFTALRSLAITAGVPQSEAWIWPLIIEGSMAQSTVALLALAHSTPSNERAHADDFRNYDLKSLAHAPHSEAETVPTPPAVLKPVRTTPPLTGPASRDFADLAAHLCARDPARRRDPELVAKALAHHHLDGWNPTRIANELNRSRSTISRILKCRRIRRVR